MFQKGKRYDHRPIAFNFFSNINTVYDCLNVDFTFANEKFKTKCKY